MRTPRRLIIGLIVLALLICAVAAFALLRSGAGDARAALDRGVAALEKGDARTARVELLNAIKAAPRSAAARMAQARALIALDDGAGAQAEIDRARALGVPVGATRHLMAQALLLQGDSDGALHEASADDAETEYRGDAARIAGRAWLAQGQSAKAQAAFEQALQFMPRSAPLWVDIGRYRLAVGDQAGAVEAAEGALAIAPGNVEALTLRGELVRDQYGLAAALPWFERALAVNADAVPTLTEYAATLADMGQARRMLSVTRRILALEPGNPRAWYMQAVLAARAGRDDLARALLAKTDGRLDNVPATMLLRGVLHMASGNATLAVDAFAALLDAQPDNRKARLLLGRAQYAKHDFNAAANTLAPIVAQADADPYALTLAARVQEGLGNRAMADDMLARAVWPLRPAAVAFASNNDPAIVNAGPPADAGSASDNIPYIRALMAEGLAGEAVARATSLRNANPGAPDAHLILGDALDAAGRYVDAARSYEAAANLRFSQDVALRLVAAWQRAGNPAQAVRALSLFLGQNPGNLEGQRLAAAAYMQAGEWANAAHMLQGVRQRVGDNDAMLMADLARAMLEQGDAKRARIYAAHAYRLMPGNPMTADIYGWALLGARENVPVATDLLEKAVAMAPGHPVFQMHLGQAYAAAGRKREAMASLGRAAAVPGFADRQKALDAMAKL